MERSGEGGRCASDLAEKWLAARAIKYGSFVTYLRVARVPRVLPRFRSLV